MPKFGKMESMIDITQLVQMAKDTIKEMFGEEMEVEIIPLAEVPKRREEFAKQYGAKIPDDFDGLFAPAKNGNKAFLLIGYKEGDELDLFEKYHHELQHAVDYFIVMKSIGELPKYFDHYTEYNAGLEGFYKVNTRVLNMLPLEERQQWFDDAKAHLGKGLAKTPSTIFDLLCYLARVSALGRIERRLDPALFAGVHPAVTDLANFIRHYQPTKEWYGEFKTKIESIPVKEKK